jgi:STE24 endopeptidase
MNTVFLLLLLFLILGYLFDLILDVLNVRNISPDLPRHLAGRYDPDKYRLSQAYLREKSRFGILVSTVGFIAVLLMFLLGGFAWVNAVVNSVTTLPVPAALLFFGILGIASDILSIPADIWSTFVIEEKYGFNRTTPRTFIFDKLKSGLLTLIIGAPLIALVVWLYTLTGSSFWLLAWLVVAIFSVLMAFFYSSLIVPLFNKQQPLPEGDLRSSIEELSLKAGFRLSRVYVIDGSRRSGKANAYFAGFGNRRRIVLYDTLISDMDTEGILAVLAHEIGHYKKKHIPAGMALSIVQTGILLFLFSLFAGNPLLSEALNIGEPSFHVSLLVFGILYSPISMITGMLFNLLSRRFEYQADEYASGMGLGTQLGNALIGLSEKNLGNLTPHPAYVFVHYSHPTLIERLTRLIK